MLTTPSPENAVPYRSGWNLLAVLGFVFTFILPPVAIILGVIALRQVKRSGERGHDLALSGIIVSVVFIVIGIGSVLAYGA